MIYLLNFPGPEKAKRQAGESGTQWGSNKKCMAEKVI